MRILALLCCIALFGCQAPGSAVTAITRAVPEAPCKASVPKRPVFPADALTGQEDLWTLGVALWADRKARQAYERELEVIAVGCTTAPEGMLPDPIPTDRP